jgi:hypothetical protein
VYRYKDNISIIKPRIVGGVSSKEIVVDVEHIYRTAAASNFNAAETSGQRWSARRV